MSLLDYLQTLRRRKWLVIAIAVVVPAAAVAYSLSQTASYSADADVLLSRQDISSALSGTPQSSSSVDATRDAQTQSELARVPPVVEAAIEAAGIPISFGAFLDQSSVTSSPNSDLLEFQVEYRTPSGAAELVNAYAREYVRYRQELDRAALRGARSEVLARLDSLLATGGSSSALYRKLKAKDEELGILLSLQTSPAVVVRTADSATKVQPKPVRNGILAVVLALILAVVLAFLLEALDTRIRSALEIAERLKLPLLARLPTPPRHLLNQNKLVMLAEPDSAAAEPFRVLRANLDLLDVDRDVRTVMVAGAVQEEGKSTTIANYAIAAARAGWRVVLLDLDLRRGDIDDLFGVADRPGIADIALGTVSLADALVPIDVNPDAKAPGSLQILPVGMFPVNPGDFIVSDTVAGIIERLPSEANLIVIDAPPLLQASDATAIAARVDSIVVVTRIGVKRPTLDELSRTLDRVAADKLGVVVTGDDSEHSSYGYYTSESAHGAA